MSLDAQSTSAKLVGDGTEWRIEGSIDYYTVVALREQGERQLAAAANQRCTIDFSSVKHMNTAALALLLCWYRKAKELNVDLKYTHIPSNLRAIAEMSELEAILEES